MDASVNKVILIGRLGTDPELRYFDSGKALCNFSLATNRSWKDRNGESQERTDWHRIVTWSRLAENCSKYLEKGRKVFVEGRLETRNWEDEEGKRHYITEVVASNVLFLGGGSVNEGPPPTQEELDEDLPF